MKRSLNGKGFTIFELLVGLVMISMVFAGSISLYLSSLRFLNRSQTNDVSTNSAVSLETISTPIGLANEAWIDGVLAGPGTGKQLTIRADYPECGDFSTSLNTPGDTSDDKFWHYGFVGNALYTTCLGDETTVVDATHTLLIPNVDVASSTFEIINPSGFGTGNVVAVHLVTTTPVATIDTNVAMGAKPKN